MKIAIIEPLGIDEKAVEKLKQDFLPENIELVYYNSAPQDDEEKIKRSEDADIVMLANMPLRKNVLEKCSKIKNDLCCIHWCRPYRYGLLQSK